MDFSPVALFVGKVDEIAGAAVKKEDSVGAVIEGIGAGRNEFALRIFRIKLADDFIVILFPLKAAGDRALCYGQKFAAPRFFKEKVFASQLLCNGSEGISTEFFKAVFAVNIHFGRFVGNKEQDACFVVRQAVCEDIGGLIPQVELDHFRLALNVCKAGKFQFSVLLFTDQPACFSGLNSATCEHFAGGFEHLRELVERSGGVDRRNLFLCTQHQYITVGQLGHALNL